MASAKPQSSADAESALKSAPNEFSFPNSHLGHLSQEQEDALSEFRRLLETEGLYTSATSDKPPSHNDALLLRFLRARRYVPKDALQQFRETEKWREANDLDNLYMNIDIDDYDESRRYYTHSIGRRDKRGLPICLFRIGALNSEAMSKYTKSTAAIRLAKPDVTANDTPKDKSVDMQNKTPPRLLRLFAIYENLIGWMTELCTALTDRPYPEVPVTQSNNIVDISNVGLRQFWSLRSHMSDATALATSHYPETLDRIFIVGAPSFFPAVWSWVKLLFDPITVSKIFILSDAQVLPTLSQYIAPENIPKRYGGSLDFEFGDLPTIDPAFADRLTWKDDGTSGIKDAKGQVRRWPKGPVKWIVREDGDWDLLAVGSVKGERRRETVATLTFPDGQGGWADQSMLRPNHSSSPIAER